MKRQITINDIENIQKIMKINSNNWNDIIENCDLTLEFVKHFEKKLREVQWQNISKYANEKILEYYFDKINFAFTNHNNPAIMNLVENEKFKDKIDWYGISDNDYITEEFIEKYKDKIIWCSIRKQKLSMDFIKKYSDKLDWDYISDYQELNEEFIEEFKDKINWKRLSTNKQVKLSEDFIRKNISKFNLFDIIDKYKLSKEFKDELKIIYKLSK